MSAGRAGRGLWAEPCSRGTPVRQLLERRAEGARRSRGRAERRCVGVRREEGTSGGNTGRRAPSFASSSLRTLPVHSAARGERAPGRGETLGRAGGRLCRTAHGPAGLPRDWPSGDPFRRQRSAGPREGKAGRRAGQRLGETGPEEGWAASGSWGAGERAADERASTSGSLEGQPGAWDWSREHAGHVWRWDCLEQTPKGLGRAARKRRGGGEGEGDPVQAA